MRAALAAFGIRLRPARGQHFLVNPRTFDRILAAAEPGPDDVILEIGAGIGSLTVALAKTGARVIAIEVDARFIPILRAVVAPYPRVRILQVDAMALTPTMLPARPTKVVANLPYSIASPLLVNLLQMGIGHRYVVMLQEEVARRIVAGPGDRAYGLLSVAIQACALPSIVSAVSRTAFFPPPQVASCIVRLDVPDEPPVPRALVPTLMAVARAAFGQRRKMLRSSLQAVEGRALSPADVEARCRAAGIDPRRRGEDLSLEEFVRLARAFGERDEPLAAGSLPGGI
ncbi:MAG: 16S rRNA (adenine(1518)-N(6)/adenine(1519)-N(6))-dimethyltransferase RsmA [Armatimonadota bacterium]|nr:16S rRNA (adenine(1518)-N(6)/adenine(1519)-N(6))-dimethyltransferase RsmA [Armatimonadota bacterium]